MWEYGVGENGCVLGVWCCYNWLCVGNVVLVKMGVFWERGVGENGGVLGIWSW